LPLSISRSISMIITEFLAIKNINDFPRSQIRYFYHLVTLSRASIICSSVNI
jgi:hypothetical protein